MSDRTIEQEGWDRHYREGRLPWDTVGPESELVRVIDAAGIPPGAAFEMGCGRGTNAVYLAERGFTVTAVDISPTAVEEAKRLASERGAAIDFRVLDLLADEDPGGPYDFLFDRGVYHAVRSVDLPAFHRTLERASRPGTTYLSLAGNANEPREPDQPGPPQVSEAEIRAELPPLFEIVDLREFRFDSARLAGDDRFLAWSILMRRR